MDKMDRLRIPRTVAGTIGTAVLGVLMLGVVTFGATSIRPLTAGNDADEQPAASEAAANLGHAEHLPQRSRPAGPADEHKGTEPVTGDEGAFREDKDQPSEAPAEEPKADPTPAPKRDEPAPTKKPAATEQPKPAPTTLALEGWEKLGKAKLAWSKYLADGFSYYKLVRSTDGTATWPLGPGDTLVAAISDPYAPYAVDAPPCGVVQHYRVFAVKATESGYQVLAASNVVELQLTCASEPPAEPSAMAFELVQTDAGVQLTWEKCSSDAFVVYKVVRSATDANPMYPLHDGDELLAAIGDPNVTGFVDDNVEPGQTWTYRILSLGEGADGWVVLGLTDAKTITVQ